MGSKEGLSLLACFNLAKDAYIGRSDRAFLCPQSSAVEGNGGEMP